MAPNKADNTDSAEEVGVQRPTTADIDAAMDKARAEFLSRPPKGIRWPKKLTDVTGHAIYVPSK